MEFIFEKLKKYKIENPEKLEREFSLNYFNQFENLNILYLEDSLFPYLIPKIIFGNCSENKDFYYFAINRYERNLSFIHSSPYLIFEDWINFDWKNQMFRISNLSPYENEDLIYSKFLEYKLEIK